MGCSKIGDLKLRGAVGKDGLNVIEGSIESRRTKKDIVKGIVPINAIRIVYFRRLAVVIVDVTESVS